MKKIVLKMIEKSVQKPKTLIALVLCITLFFVFQMRNLETQSDVEGLLPDGLVEESYDTLAVLIKGDQLFTLEGLALFQKCINELERELSAVRVIEPFSHITLSRSGRRLVPVPFSPGGIAPLNDKELEIFLGHLESDPFAVGLLTSKDIDALTAYLFIPKGASYLESEEIIAEVLAPLEDDFELVLTGTIPFSARTESYLSRSFPKLMIMVVLTILLSYYLGFRSRRAVFLPVVLIITGTVWSIGAMALAGFKLTMVSIVSPPLVLTLGSSYSIHILNEYYRHVALGENRQRTIINAVGEVSGTVLMASLTTLTGLLCLLLASIEETREFALTTSFGIISTALLSLTLFPAFLVLQPELSKDRIRNVSSGALNGFFSDHGPRLVKQKKTSIIIPLILMSAFIFLYPMVSFNTSPSKYFPSNSKVIKDMREFAGSIGGIDEMSIRLKAPDGEAGYFLRPDVLTKVYKLEEKLVDLDDVSYLLSFPSYAGFASKVMTGKNGDFSSRGLVLLVSKLFSSDDGNKGFANKDYSEIQLSIRVYNKSEERSIDEEDTLRILNSLEIVLSESIPSEIEWELKGMSLLFLDLSRQMRSDFIRSTLAAILAIWILTSLSFRSAFMGLMSLVPLLAGISASFILMAAFRIPLDMATIMVSCLAIGVGVDDAIHLLIQYRRQVALYPGDPVKALSGTLQLTGRPIILTTLSIVSGLLFLSFAQFQPIRYFGLLIVFTLSAACLATLFILPPLLLMREERKLKSRGVQS